MFNQLELIANKEKLKYDNESLNIITNISKGDMRKAINLMQSSTCGTDKKKVLDKNLCYNIAGFPKPEDILKITNILLNKNKSLELSTKKIQKYVIENGYSISIILKEIIEVIINKIINDEINTNEYAYIFSELSNLESKVSKSTFGDIYLSMMVAIFKQ